MNLVPNSIEMRSSLRGIDEIPLDKRKNICTSIDYSITRHDGYWEKLVNELGFNENDSKNFQLAFAKNQSPTENLLRECGYRNYRICTLYHVLKKIGLVKLAKENLDNLDDSYVTPYTPYIPMLPPHGLAGGVNNEKPQRKPTESTSSTSSLSASESEKIGGLDTFHFSYEDIAKGTDNFSPSMKLGAGAFGKVYKVRLKNTTFACKVLTIDNDNPLNFSIVSKHREHSDLRNELRYLAEYRHPNIIPLYGWSLDGKDPCLIYQYMKNGSLQDCLQRLKGNVTLKWLTRAKIACDAARGLQFLHEAKEKPLIHGDIKTANILLDESFVAKLGDFGLAREGPRSRVTGSYIKLGNEHTPGTMGYLAKEYMDSKKLSVQVDTYAFGVVLLELYTGRRAYDRSERKATFLRDYMDDIANTVDEDGEDADTLLFDHQDPQIERLPRKTALEFVKLALECCHFKRTKRPSMLSTLRRLEKIRDEVKIMMNSSGEVTPKESAPVSPESNPAALESKVVPEGKTEQKSNQNNLGRHNWISTHLKDTQNHNLSKIPIEDDDHSLATNLDSSLPHGSNNLYLPPEDYDLGKEMDHMNLGSQQRGPGRPNDLAQKTSMGATMQHVFPSFSPAEMYGSNQAHNPFLPFDKNGTPNPVSVHNHPWMIGFMTQQSNPMSPIFPMWSPNMPPHPSYPNYSNLPPQYFNHVERRPVPSPNEGFGTLDPKYGQPATTPISPGAPWNPEACFPEPFSSLDLDSPNPATSAPSFATPQADMYHKNNSNVVYAPQYQQDIQYGFHHGQDIMHQAPHNIRDEKQPLPGDKNNLKERAESETPKRIAPKPHAVNAVTAEIIEKIESGCESYSQVFETSSK